MRRLLFSLIAACTVCAGAAAVYGPTLARQIFPQFFVFRASANLVREIVPEHQALQLPILLSEILQDSWRQEFIIGLNHLEADVNPNIMAAAQVLSLRNVVRWDRAQNVYAAELALQMAATPLVSADLHINHERIAVTVPMLLDQSLTINPRRLGGELGDSILGTFVQADEIDDAMFYEVYSALLEVRREVHVEEFIASLARLAANVNFQFAGREDSLDVFLMTIPAEQANISAGYLTDQVIFTEDAVFTIYIDGSSFSRIYSEWGSFIFEEPGKILFNTVIGDGTIEYDNNNRLYLSLSMTYADGTLIEGSIDWDYENIEASVNLSYHALVNVYVGLNGTLQVFPDNNRIETHLRALNINANDQLDVTLNIRHMLFSDTAPIVFDDSNTRSLTSLTILDLARITARAADSPLGGIIMGGF